MADSSWVTLAWLLKRSDRVADICDHIADWPEGKCEDELSAVDGALLILSANYILQEYSDELVANETSQKAIRNILKCLLRNTQKNNRCVLFKVLDVKKQGFLSPEDKELCYQLLEEAYKTEDQEGESTADKESGEQTLKPAGESKEEFGAKKLLAKLTAEKVERDPKTHFQDSETGTSFLKEKFWTNEGLGKTIITACVESSGFDPIRKKGTEALSSALISVKSWRSPNMAAIHATLLALLQSVESASILFYHQHIWNPASVESMQLLQELILLCTDAASACSYTLGYISRFRESVSSDPCTPSDLTEKLRPKTFSELLSCLNCYSKQKSSSPLSIGHTILGASLKTCNYQPGEAEIVIQKTLPKQVVDNIPVLILSRLLEGLYPALCRRRQQSELPKYVRFNPHMTELLNCGLEILGTILEEAAKEGEEGRDVDIESVNMQNFNLLKVYSKSARLYLINSCCPLLDVLLGIVETSYRKSLTMASETPLGTAAATAKTEAAENKDVPPSKKSKIPSKKSVNTVIQHILEAAVAEKVASEKQEGDKGEGQVPEQREEQDRELLRSASSSSRQSSEEGEGVYVLFHEEVEEQREMEMEGALHNPIYHPLAPPLGTFTSPPPTAPPLPPHPLPPLPPKKKNQADRPLPALPDEVSKPKGTASSDIPLPLRRGPFLNLADTTLVCLFEKIINIEHPVFQKFVKCNLKVENIKCLGRILHCVDSDRSKFVQNISDYQSIRGHLVELVNELVLSGVFANELFQESLLQEMGLAGGAWPLNIGFCTLSTLARLVVWRLGQPRQGNDSLCLDIWNRFFDTLQANAIRGGKTSPSEDISVSHFQLIIFLFHHLTEDTKYMFLEKCIGAVIKVASERWSGVKSSPLGVARLLMVMDYFVFEFSGEETQHFEQLTEQIQHNLFSSTSLQQWQSDVTKRYQGTIEIDYNRVLLKFSQQGSVDNMRPRFYGLRPVKMLTLGEEPMEEGEEPVDPEVCHSRLLKYKGPNGEDYGTFYQSLVYLFGSILEARGTAEDSIASKVLDVTAGRQCTDLCQYLLTALPPSESFLKKFFTDEGFNIQTSEGAASLVVFVRFLSLLRFQTMDTSDVIEALENSGMKEEEAEDLVDKIVFLNAPNEFFIPQALQYLAKAAKLPEDSIPSEMTVILLDLLATLVDQEVSPVVSTPKESSLKRKKGKRRRKGDSKGDIPKGVKFEDEGTDTVESKVVVKRPIRRRPTPADTTERIPDFFNEALPIISKLLVKIMKVINVFIIDGETESEGGGDVSEPAHEKNAYDLMLQVGSVPKGKRSLFVDCLPSKMKERLTIWTDALEVAKGNGEDSKFVETSTLLNYVLIKHLVAYSGYRPYSCIRSLKTVVATLSRLLHELSSICDSELVDSVVEDLIPVSCRKTAEKLALLDPIAKCSEGSHINIKISSVKVMMVAALELVHHPAAPSLNCVVRDAIEMMKTILEDQSLWPALTLMDSTDCPTDVVSLVLRTAADGMPLMVIDSGLELLLTVIQLQEKVVDPQAVLLSQSVSNFAVKPAELVRKWLRSIILTPNEEAIYTMGIELVQRVATALVQEECLVDVDAVKCLLTQLIPLGPEALDHIQKHPDDSNMFKSFWSICSTLASSESVNEHLTLLKAAAEWLPKCVEVMASSGSDAEHTKGPVLALLEYLLQLASALHYGLDQEGYVAQHDLVTDKAITLQDSPEIGEEGFGGEEEDGASDDEGLNEKLCTFAVTQKSFMTQYWYHCYTCGLAENTGVCSICAKVCHKDHELAFSKYGAFFCDCGAKGDGYCKALVKRSDEHSLKKKSKTPKQVTTKKTDTKEAKAERAPPVEQKNARKVSGVSPSVIKLSQQIENSKKELKEYFESTNIIPKVLDLLHQLRPAILTEAKELSCSSGLCLAQKALHDLHYKEKNIENVETLMAAILGSPEGAFDNVKLNFNGDQGQVMKQLISSYAIHRVAMCCVGGSLSKRQHLAVSHDKGKVAIIQLSDLLKQSDSNKRKLTLTRLSSFSLPFTILSLTANPSFNSYLAICGLKECVVYSFNSAGQVSERISLHPSVDFNGYIVKVLWVPGSKTELAIVSETFIKIYDLSVDILSPQYCFTVMSGKVKDATFAINTKERFLVVMMASGVLYSQPIVPECSAADGPVYLVHELAPVHDQVDVSDGIVCSGGASVYYSHSLELLLFSFMNGKTFASHMNATATKLEKLFYIPLKGVPVGGATEAGEPAPSKGSSATPLVQWTEMGHYPGMVCCLAQATSTPVVMFFKPDVIQVHELKATKSKVQGMVAMYQMKGDGPSDGEKTTLVLLSEDGSLKIYLAGNNEDTKYWHQPQFQANSPLATLRPRRRRMAEGQKGENVKFPIDFFEHCLPWSTGSDVEFGGTDLLHTYNSAQLKNRLNTNGMYICNTRASGFTVEVNSNLWKHHVMVGVRVLLGNKPPDRIPSYIEVFGRKVPTAAVGSTPRWVDVPFTKEESLQAEKTFKLKFGPSKDPSGISFIDSIRVYGKAKNVFGWPEVPPEAAGGQSNGAQPGDVGAVDESSDSSLPSSMKSITVLDRMVCNSLSLLGNCCACVEVPDEIRSSCFDASKNLLTVSLPQQVQFHCRYLMSSVVRDKEEFYRHTDTALLSYVVQALYWAPTDQELFQRLLLALLTVSKRHPENLAQLLKEENLKELCSLAQTSPESCEVSFKEDFITKLNNLFWKLLDQTPTIPTVASVATPMLLCVDLVTMSLVEVMWSFCEFGSVEVKVILPHLIKMLQTQDPKVSSTCTRTLIRLVKPKPKVTVAGKQSKTADKEVTEGPVAEQAAGEEGEDETKKQQITQEVSEPLSQREAGQVQQGGSHGNQQAWDSLLAVLPQQLHQVFNVLRMEFSNPAEAMEHIIANPDQFMAAMEGVPGFDDDALMNIALILSAQEQQQGQQVASGGEQQQAPSEPQSSQEEEQADESELVSYDSGSNESLSGPELSVPVLDAPEEENKMEQPGESQRSSTSSSHSTLTPPTHRRGNGTAKPKAQVEDGSSGDSSGEDEQGLGEDEHLVEDIDQTLTDEPTSSSTAAATRDAQEGETEAATSDQLARLSLLKELVDVLPTVVDGGGLSVIPIMQVILSICTHLNMSSSEKRVLVDVLKKCFTLINFDTEEAHCLVERTPQHEVKLVLLRFLGILLGYRKKDKLGKDAKATDVTDAKLLYVYTAKLLQKETNCVEVCLKLLQTLLKQQEVTHGEESSTSPSSPLKVAMPATSTDLTPFFQRDYVKANSNDLFRAYHRILADMAVMLPTELKKISDGSRKSRKLSFSSEWIDVLCEFLNNPSALSHVTKKPLKKLLVSICGSKDDYRQVRDMHYFTKKMDKVRDLCYQQSPILACIPAMLPHSVLLKVIDHLKVLCDQATSRPQNWQDFCIKDEGTLSLLMFSSVSLDEGLAPFIIKLLLIALTGKPLKVTEKGISDIESKLKNCSDNCNKMADRMIEVFLNHNLLQQFIVSFLLRSNSTVTRWQAHTLVYCLHRFCDTKGKVHLVDMLWKLWPEMPTYGLRATQFVDILGYLTISMKGTLTLERKLHIAQEAICQLKNQNRLLTEHPNAHIYAQLAGLVNFDGYYLESEPCFICTNPELPNSSLKLMGIKGEVRYSPNAMFVKLKNSYSISQFTILISDIKRSKMVRVINLYYSSRTVQNAIELKNKKAIWMKAQSATLTQGQNEVKFEFPLPIVACNIVLEFAEFFTNLQASPEVLQCPRCGTSVPAHPGVCSQCGENVFQCHKCRSINYDEKDPFLCNSCGVSKYAKFDYSLVGKECTSVDPIETDEDRSKTLSNINSLLEDADREYKRLVDHRHALDELLATVSSGSTPGLGVPSFGRHGMWAVGNTPSSNEGIVNRSIQEVALCYGRNCKLAYRLLSNLIRSVVESRKEVSEYDRQKVELARHEGIPVSPAVPPVLGWTKPREPEGGGATQKSCYGCATAAVGHCITLLKALAFCSETRQALVERKLISELVQFNQRGSNHSIQTNVQDLLCLLTKNNPRATEELCSCIFDRVMLVVKNYHLSANVATAVQPEINLLTATLAIRDNSWEERLKTVMMLFQKTRRHSNPVVVESVALPCLAIMKKLSQVVSHEGPKKLSQVVSHEGPKKLSQVVSQEDSTKTTNMPKEEPKTPPDSKSWRSPRAAVSARKWLKGDDSATFEKWAEKEKEEQEKFDTLSFDEQRSQQLQHKFAQRWKARTHKFATARAHLYHTSWLRSMLFNSSSRAARLAACKMVESLCQGNQTRTREMIDMLFSYLPDVRKNGEKAAEYLQLFMKLSKQAEWRTYLAAKGVLASLGELLTAEIQDLRMLEKSTLSADVAQGYALNVLSQLLQSFLSVDVIKQQHKGKLVGVVLRGYLGLKCLVIQRTKRIDDTENLLLKILEDLTSGTEEEKKQFMAECVAIMEDFSTEDLVTPIFVFERFCNVILPEKSDEVAFYLQLDKDPQQEEFLQGRMQGNPYKSSDPGTGPLMRDIKNKICTDCELVALLEDDSGMELLVANKIISLDLPVKDVYKKVWLAQSSNPGSCMRVVYRMRGLLGDATEDIIESLDNGGNQNIDEEEVYHMADVMSQCGGLEAALTRLSHVQDINRGHQLIAVILKFLSYCLKLKINRQYVIQPRLNTLNILLASLNQALRYEHEHSGGVGAGIAEKVLSVMESILLEASSSLANVDRASIVRQTSTGPVIVQEQSQLSQLLDHIETPYVQSNPSIRKALMKVLPYLTFGDIDSMHCLLDHFVPYLEFDKFDTDHSTETSLYLDCFTAVSNGIGTDASGAKLKNLVIDQGVVQLCIDYISKHVPNKESFSVSMDFESPAWRECLARPALPYVLNILTGLCQNHHSTQAMVTGVVEQLHLLEQVSSSEHIGSMTEGLLKVLDKKEVVEKIEEARQVTKREKMERAKAVRSKLLKEYGMKLNEKGQVIAESSVMEDLEKTVKICEEEGLTCCVCRDGYLNEPKKLVGVYTFTKRANLDEFEKKPRKTVGFTTVTHFNVIHFDCHTSAVMTARGRNEWESAMLQNSNTRCNGLLPIWGPEVSDSAFASCLARHNGYVREATGHYDASYSAWIHDIKLLLLKFANEQSFSKDSGGGGPQSNIYLIPYLLHVAIYVLNSTRLYASGEKGLSNFVSAAVDTWVPSSYELEGTLYMLVCSLPIYTLGQWKENKLTFLKRLLTTAHARSTSMAAIEKLPPETAPAEYAIYKPSLVFFGLIDIIHKTLKKKIEVSGEALPETLLDHIRQSTASLCQTFDKVLATYQDELLTSESFEEMLDVLDLLGEVPNPGDFLKSLLASVS